MGIPNVYSKNGQIVWGTSGWDGNGKKAEGTLVSE